jgi:2-polyprenyl-3-methyl-5-hydroxy-6-metoxy-1,4-benzoquinol methylase
LHNSTDTPLTETRAMQDTGVCPLCSSIQHRHQYTDPSAPEGQNRELVECLECSLVYVPHARELAFNDLLASAYLDDWALLDLSGIAYQYNVLLKAKQQLGVGNYRELTTEPALLDVGCGAGYFLDHCRAHGWRVMGVEPWREIADWAGKYLKLDVLPTSLANAKVNERSFDAVTAHDVLQFMRDPLAFLRRCHDLLMPGGVLVVTVPNFGSREREAQGWQWHQIIPYAHLVYFSADTLKRAARQAGFGRTMIEPVGGAYGDAQLILSTRRGPEPSIKLADISGTIEESNLPVLDRTC